MNKLIYIMISLFITIGCNSGKKQNTKSNPPLVTEVQTEELVKAPESNIPNLKKSFIAKDEVAFLKQFPNDFNQFNNYFGWDTINEKPKELYEVGNDYIDYWFSLLNNEHYKAYEKEIISICTNGKWEPDAVNYFQDKSLSHIKENQKYYLINDLKHDEVKAVLFFLFNGPHPKFDSDFASNLNPTKKNVLNEIFETSFFYKDDVDENDKDLLTVNDISFYTNNDDYFIKEIDINNDDIPDKIVSNKRYQGEELFLFIANEDTYELALKTINFSEDGGNQIVDIKESANGFVVVTAFLGSGFLESHFYISFDNNRWILTNTVYKTRSSNQEDAFIYVCDVKQNIDISSSIFLEHIKSIPNESDRDKTCLKQKDE